LPQHRDDNPFSFTLLASALYVSICFTLRKKTIGFLQNPTTWQLLVESYQLKAGVTRLLLRSYFPFIQTSLLLCTGNPSL